MISDDEERRFRAIADHLSDPNSKLVEHPVEDTYKRLLWRVRMYGVLLGLSLLLFLVGFAFDPFISLAAVPIFIWALLKVLTFRPDRELLRARAGANQARKSRARQKPLPTVPPAPLPSRMAPSHVTPRASGLMARLEERWQQRMRERGLD